MMGPRAATIARGPLRTPAGDSAHADRQSSARVRGRQLVSDSDVPDRPATRPLYRAKAPPASSSPSPSVVGTNAVVSTNPSATMQLTSSTNPAGYLAPTLLSTRAENLPRSARHVSSASANPSQTRSIGNSALNTASFAENSIVS